MKRSLCKYIIILLSLIVLLPSISLAGFCGFLRANTAANVRIGPFLDELDGVTVEAGLLISKVEVRISKEGGPFSAKAISSALVHDQLGFYWFRLGTADTNTPGRLMIVINESGALMVVQTYQVIDETVYDVHYKDIP